MLLSVTSKTAIKAVIYLASKHQEGERIGQLIVVPYPQFEPVFVDDIAEGARGENGYGSTDEPTTEPVESIAEEVEELNN